MSGAAATVTQDLSDRLIGGAVLSVRGVGKDFPTPRGSVRALAGVDFAIERRKSGVDALTAIHEAAVVRFRPIIMTTLAAIFGTLPIALGTGAGHVALVLLAVHLSDLPWAVTLVLLPTVLLCLLLNNLNRALTKGQLMHFRSSDDPAAARGD